MKASLKYLVVLFFVFYVSMAAAQGAEMADGMRSEGKIYVVVSIILVVLAGLVIYLFLMDRKVSRLERKFEGKG